MALLSVACFVLARQGHVDTFFCILCQVTALRQFRGRTAVDFCSDQLIPVYMSHIAAFRRGAQAESQGGESAFRDEAIRRRWQGGALVVDEEAKAAEVTGVQCSGGVGD